jgi:predicted dehydrogenase
MSNRRKKYAIIGLSGRSATFTNELLNAYKGHGEIVALLDSNSEKMNYFNEKNQTTVPGYNEDEFDKLVAETMPDVTIISTTDATHHTYIVASLKHDIDVFTEKPMTIDAQKVREILAAEKESKAQVKVTFNYRYSPVHTQIKEMILDGFIGTPTSVDMNYRLDTFHGASYFKRWNRYEKISGSLLITKACHHFDLINWWIGQKPVEVFAYGSLRHYGKNGGYNPEKIDGRRCSKCEEKCDYYLRHSGGSEDEHLINFNNPGCNERFGAVDGYYGDRCIFDFDIDTWDTFAVTVKYDGGTLLSYSLNASVPYEGYRLAINGTEGRIESESITGSGARLPFPAPKEQNIEYFPMFGGRQTREIINKGGGHGGGDPLMKKELFLGADENDRTKRAAGVIDGAMSVLVGTAARESLKSGKPVKIANLLKA